MSVVYITIGNSDDKLKQRDWAAFYVDVDQLIRANAVQVYGAWISNTQDPWQNACWCAELPADLLAHVETELSALAYRYDQDSIAMAGAEVEFIEPMPAAVFRERLSPAQQKLLDWVEVRRADKSE